LCVSLWLINGILTAGSPRVHSDPSIVVRVDIVSHSPRSWLVHDTLDTDRGARAPWPTGRRARVEGLLLSVRGPELDRRALQRRAVRTVFLLDRPKQVKPRDRARKVPSSTLTAVNRRQSWPILSRADRGGAAQNVAAVLDGSIVNSARTAVTRSE